jgi:chemotaxis protein methyltransferase CheR
MVVEAMVTHETSFFRDPQVWEALARGVLPRLLAREGPIRLWSAGTATGQEAYSLAMLMRELTDAKSAERCSILATDISEAAVRIGTAGEYEPRELARGVSPQRRQRFFFEHQRRWRVNEELRRMIEFRRLNLAMQLPPLGRFHLICCRNLLIYFNLETRVALAEQLNGLLADGGWLLLGSAENLYGVSERFASEMVEGALIYRKA